MVHLRHVLGSVVVLAGIGLAGAAGASPFHPAADMPYGYGPHGGYGPSVERVADGCGPGYRRGWSGYCRPMGHGPGFRHRDWDGPRGGHGYRHHGHGQGHDGGPRFHHPRGW